MCPTVPVITSGLFRIYAVPNKIYVLGGDQEIFLSVSSSAPDILQSFPTNIDSCILITVHPSFHRCSYRCSLPVSTPFGGFPPTRCRFLNWDTTYQYEPVSYRHVLICRKEKISKPYPIHYHEHSFRTLNPGSFLFHIQRFYTTRS